MLQIIGLLLCVYLCYKGLEILQLSLTSSNESAGHKIIGGMAFVSSVIIAALFAYWLIQAGEAMSDRMPRLP